MGKIFNKGLAIVVVVWLFSGEAVACPPTAIICGSNTKYVEAGQVIWIDGACSSDNGSIVKYEWDFDYNVSFQPDYYETEDYHPLSAFDGKHYKYYSAGTHTARIRVTDNDGLETEAQCTVHALQVEVDVPTSYPQWVHVDNTISVGCTVTPSGLGRQLQLVEGGWFRDADVLAKCICRGPDGFERHPRPVQGNGRIHRRLGDAT